MNHESGDESLDMSSSGASFLRRVLQAEPTPRMPFMGERLGGTDDRRYRVLEWMGGGGMGQVFRARDETLHREVALKFLLSRAGAGEEVLREARAVARLDHENIVRIFDVSEWRNTPGEPGLAFLVMECLEGESLAALLKRGPLDVRRALELLDGITAGLAHAHERGIVHRDLKPSNVFLLRQGTVKLLDFGLSHLGLASAADASHLSTGGTPAYMAPEQWRGESQDARVDVWASGVVLYELLTGRPLHPGATVVELRAWVTSPEPVPLVRTRRPEVPREVEAFLVTALAKDPARRFSSLPELREALHELRTWSQPRGEAPRSFPAQRGQVTVVSCQLSGLAEGAASLDAEDAAELELAFHEACAKVIGQHGGTMTLFMGSEVLACFGHLKGREDDSERAVRAGLQLSRELPDTLQRGLPHLSLQGLSVWTGIHTDLMAVRGRALQGEAPKVAAWLARRAGPGGVVVGETSWKLVRGAFRTEPLGAQAFEGFSGTVRMEAHRVLDEREVASRFERTRLAGRLSPLVGREHELGRLLEHWTRARHGQGAFVLVSGEAGIGKSRLIQELCERVAAEPTFLLRIQCWSWFSTQAESALPELLQDVAWFPTESSPPARLRLLEERLQPMGLTLEDAHLVGRLLSLPVPESSPVHQRPPEWCKERTLEVLVHLVLHGSRERAPMLLVVEDLHWADSLRLELLGLLLEHVEKARLLVVLSARPEFQPDWPRHAWFHRLALERLPVGLAATLVREEARGHALSEELVQRLVDRTDGIPLFIEELTRMVLEGGAEASIPVTLHELLLARLDLLPSRQKDLAQLCAVVGRDFSHALLAAVSRHDEATLHRELSGLMEAGLLRAREAPDGCAYQFRHGLLQDAAYQSLSRSTRRQYHQRISRVLEERFPSLVETRPEVLAYHLTEAGEHAPAIGHWERAGVLAFQRQAHPEALSHLTRALELQQGLADAGQRLPEELRLRLLLGFAMMEVTSLGAPEVERMYARIRELVFQLGDALPRLELPIWGLAGYLFSRGQLPEAQELAERFVDLGQRHDHRGLLLMGCWMRAVILSCWGRQREAMACLERARACSEPTLEEHRTMALRYWVVPLAAVLAYGAIVKATLGRMEESRRWAQEALELAERVGHPHTRVFTQVYVALAHAIRGEVTECLKLMEQAIAFASERSFKVWLTWAMLLRGWAVSVLGRPHEGLALMRRELEHWRVLGLGASIPHNLSLVADIHFKLGQLPETLAAVEEGLARSAETGESIADANLHQLRGECLRLQGQARDARHCFLRAISIAREQGMVGAELRATMSLCRLLKDLGRPGMARRLLSRTLARFETGGEWVVLQAARALLDELQAVKEASHDAGVG